jgi:hypothetical protein
VVNSIFIIRYKIFEKDIEELKNLDTEEILREYDSIYGWFSISLNNSSYLLYPSRNEKELQELRGLSEIISIHFSHLIQAYKYLQKSEIKYIENSNTWLEIVKHNDLLNISELSYPITKGMNIIEQDKNLFKSAEKSEIINEIVYWEQFEDEIRLKTNKFVSELEAINPILLKIPYYSDIVEFVKVGS